MLNWEIRCSNSKMNGLLKCIFYKQLNQRLKWFAALKTFLLQCFQMSMVFLSVYPLKFYMDNHSCHPVLIVWKWHTLSTWFDGYVSHFNTCPHVVPLVYDLLQNIVWWGDQCINHGSTKIQSNTWDFIILEDLCLTCRTIYEILQRLRFLIL